MFRLSSCRTVSGAISQDMKTIKHHLKHLNHEHQLWYEIPILLLPNNFSNISGSCCISVIWNPVSGAQLTWWVILNRLYIVDTTILLTFNNQHSPRFSFPVLLSWGLWILLNNFILRIFIILETLKPSTTSSQSWVAVNNNNPFFRIFLWPLQEHDCIWQHKNEVGWTFRFIFSDDVQSLDVDAILWSSLHRIQLRFNIDLLYYNIEQVMFWIKLFKSTPQE